MPKPPVHHVSGPCDTAYLAAAAGLRVAALLAASALLAAPVAATPTGLTYDRATPTAGNTLYVARTAANNPLAPPTFQLKADLYFDNLSGDPDEEYLSGFRWRQWS